MKIDAHQHFWRYDAQDYPWIDDSMHAIRRDFMPADLEPLLREAGFDGCVTVQARTSDEDTSFLLKLADQYPFIKAVVGWTDLTAPLLEDSLQKLSAHPKLKGIRHTIQSEPSGFMAEENFLKGVAKLREFGLSYDILISEEQMPECVEMLARLPEMNLVIDHLAKPKIREGFSQSWTKNMKKIAEYPHVHLKLSGLVSEADWQHWKKEDFEPYLENCFELFGAERLMIGSDWPVCRTAATYGETIDVVENYCRQMSTTEYNAVMGKTAACFYGV